MSGSNEDLTVPKWWCEVCTRVVTKVSPKLFITLFYMFILYICNIRQCSGIIFLRLNHRYKIHLLVKDETGDSKFMLLDSIAKTIVCETVEKLLNGSFDEVTN